ncbi:hypothetical protein ACOME3_003123 [Neoechinorhynchus agilis]
MFYTTSPISLIWLISIARIKYTEESQNCRANLTSGREMPTLEMKDTRERSPIVSGSPRRRRSPGTKMAKKRRDRSATTSSSDLSSSTTGEGSSTSRTSSSRSSSTTSSSRSSSPRRRRTSMDERELRISKIHVGKLTRNINRDHLNEIFENYGKVKQIEMPPDRMHHHLNRGYAYVEFESPKEAQRACEYMNGAMIDGQEVGVSIVNPQHLMSGGGGGRGRGNGNAWRRDYRQQPPPPRRSPVRRSKSVDDRKRRYSRSSSD